MDSRSEQGQVSPQDMILRMYEYVTILTRGAQRGSGRT